MRTLWKWLMILSGMVLLIAGLLTFPLPIPIGLPLLLFGLALLVRHSTEGKKRLIRLALRFPLLQRLLKRKKPPTANPPIEEGTDG